MQDIGAGKGKYYAVNYPLRDGIDDESYEAIFRPVSKQRLVVSGVSVVDVSLGWTAEFESVDDCLCRSWPR